MRSGTRSRGGRRAVALVAAVAIALAASGSGGSGGPGRAIGAATALGAAPGAGDGRLDLASIVHDSRDPLYRSPVGAVPVATTVRLRVLTAAADAASVEAHLTTSAGERDEPLAREAGDIPCPPDGPTADRCDAWAISLPLGEPAIVSYRFVVHDGDATAYLSDDPRGDGGPGQVTRFESRSSWVITAYRPTPPVDWLANGVVYQVFPDRFANGDASNDPTPTAARYGWPPDAADRVRPMAWTAAPESPNRGRDEFGGDLAGLRAKLPYLRDLGVTVVYLNPIFAAASNHGYDTRDYRTIDPRFGTERDWQALVRTADGLGIRILLDGVFNHVSSDGPYLDRYGHYASVGACESVESHYRGWFVFRPAANGPCAGPDGPHTMSYLSWQGIDSLPVLNKRVAAVRDLVYGADDAVARTWLEAGASGWRLDAMADFSFPADWWPAFRAAVKATRPNAAIVGELWTRDEVLRFALGDTADTTMSYRFREAVLGYLARLDANGLPDDGTGPLPPSVVASKLAGIAEDYPPPFAAAALNLLDSHDTERALWTLSPGDPGPGKETAEATAVAKARLRLAAVLQFTLPGAPTIYYGDEVGVTGGDDPDDRRTFPAGGGDRALASWYQHLARIRAGHPVLRSGDVRFALADDATDVLAFLRTSADGVAVVALNPSARAVDVRVPLAASRPDEPAIRDGVAFGDLVGGDAVRSEGGGLALTLPPSGVAILVSEPGQDLEPPGAPEPAVGAAGTTVSWAPVDGAVRYEVWRSPLAGGGYERVATTTDASWSEPDGAPAGRPAGMPAGGTWHVIVRAVDAAGNVGSASAEVAVANAPVRRPNGGDEASGSIDPVLALVGLALAAVAIGVVAFLGRRGRARG